MMMINFLVPSFLLWSSISIGAFPLLPNRHVLSTATNIFKRQRHHNYILFSGNNDKYGNNMNPMVNDDDDDDDDDDKESSAMSSTAMSSAIAEANILRAQAEVIRAEARAMELALRERASKQRKDKELITDEIITEIFSTLKYQNPQSTSSSDDIKMTTIINDDDKNNDDNDESTTTSTAFLPDARVVADRLKHGKFSRQQILSVVDRLHERYREDIAKSHDLMEYEQQQKLQFNETTVIVVLLQASLLLDEQFVVANDAALQETTTTNSSISTSTSMANPEVPSSVLSSLMTNGQLEKSIQLRILELQQQREVERNQRISAEINRIAAMSDGSSESNGTTDNTLLEIEGEMTPSFIPMWVPSSFVPYIISLNDEQSSSSAAPTTSANSNSTIATATTTMSTLGPTEVDIIKNEVLMGSRFYLTSFESIQGAALFRGNIRTSLGRVPSSVVLGTNDDGAARDNNKGKNMVHNYIFRLLGKYRNKIKINTNKDGIHHQHDNNTAMVFADIQERLDKVGLGEKIQLFLLPDPEGISASGPSRTTTMGATYNADSSTETPVGSRPVILALPKALSPDESKLKRSWIHNFGRRLCYPLAAMSTFIYSFSVNALNPNFFNSLVHKRDLTVLYSCIPLILGVIAVQTIHEAAHYLVARRRKIKIGPPVPIPSLHIASFPFFGCITPLKSFPPNRAALLDFALSGPLSALALSLGFVFGGIFLTSRASALDIARFPVIPVANMKSSFLLGSILSYLLPKTMMLPLAQPIPMHPFFVVGTSGLISSALNLLPIFRLDGGRACFAAMGQRQGAVISVFTILWLISLIISGVSSILLSWTVLISLLQLRIEIPCRDECTEVDGKRIWLWLASFVLSMSILIPFPRGVS